jgi:hypothetical protein
MIASSLPVPAPAAAPPAVSEPVNPAVLNFPVGGGWVDTDLTLERNAHVKEARLSLGGATLPRDVEYRVNATTVGNGSANAWWGGMDASPPDQSVEAYVATPFNATMVANASVRDGALAGSPPVANYSYQLFIVRVSALDVIELRVLWAGYAQPMMPIDWGADLYLYNFTSMAWDFVGAHPSFDLGVQNVTFNASSPANYIKPDTGSVAVLAVGQLTNEDVFTDLVSLTTVIGVYPRPAIDVASDGTVDWRFDAPGWGGLGRQTEFEDGRIASSFDFPDGGAVTESTILLPTGSLISGADLVLRSTGSPGSRNWTGSNFWVGANDSARINASSLPTNARATTAYVSFQNATQANVSGTSNNVSQSGTWTIGCDFVDSYRYVGEVFTNRVAGKLIGVEFMITGISGNPGPLVVEVRNDTDEGKPGPIVLAIASLNQNSVISGQWNRFDFGGFQLGASTNYSIVLLAPAVPTSGGADYYTISGTSSETFPDGQGWSYINVSALGETWSRVNNSDLIFQSRLITAVNSSSGSLLRVDGFPGTLTTNGSYSELYYEISGFSAGSGFHEFAIENRNSVDIRFNWTLDVSYSRLAEHVVVSLQNPNATIAVLDNISAGVDIPFESALSNAVQASTNLVIGPNGVSFVRVTIGFSSSSQGRLEVSLLDIRYSLELPTDDISARIDSYLWATSSTPSRTSIPLRIYSPGASTLSIVDAAITYDRPPEYFGFPANETDEDVPLAFDLNTVFHDDYDNANLSYTFQVLSGQAVAMVALRDRYNLTITSLDNTSGTVVVNVTARDSQGLTNWSGPVTFNVLSVNDPPFLTISSINATWGQISTVDLTTYIVDAESPAVSTTITFVLGAQATIVDRSLVFDFPVNAADVDLSVTLSDGVDEATYPLHIHPRQSNTPPELLPIPTVEIPNNAAYGLDLKPFARDVEDALAALHFDLAITAGNASALAWTIETNATSTYLKLIPRGEILTNVTTQLRVTDRDGNVAAQTLGVRIIAPPNVPPRIVGIPPTVTLEGTPVQIFLVTKYSDPEDALDPTVVTWQVSGAPGDPFDAEIDPDTQVLTITPKEGASGTGSLTLTLRDSGGATDTRTIDVAVQSAPPSSDLPILAVGLFFAAVVLLAAVFARRARDPRTPPLTKPLKTLESEEPGSGEASVLSLHGGETDDAEEPLDAGASGSTEDSNAAMGNFLRGLTDAPAYDDDDQGAPAVELGIKSGLESSAAALAAPEPGAVGGGKAKGHLGELYLVSIKDGGTLYQVPPIGLPALEQVEENEFLQWAFNTVRNSIHSAETARLFDWKGAPVIIARGNHFYIVGRARGEAMDSLLRELEPLVAEIDHNFPGDTREWERTDVVDTVGDVLRRLVK